MSIKPTADGSRSPAGWLNAISTQVQPEWIDYNDHLTESAYLKLFGDATDVVLALIGAGPDYVAAGHSYYTAETHIRYMGQARLGEPIAVRSRVLAVDAKRLHLFHEMDSLTKRAVIASGEHMLVHVDTRAGTAAPAPADALGRTKALVLQQAHLAPPVNLGRRIKMPG